MSLRATIVGQFRKPHGVLGGVAGWIMAHRPSNRARNLWTVDLLDIQPSDRVVDIGCGPGIALEASLAKISAGSALGLDHSATMIAQTGARNAAARDDGRLELRQATLDDAGLADQSFDKIWSANVVQFLPDQTAAFGKILAALKPGGVSATTYMPRNKNARRADAVAMAEKVAGHMQAAGFVDIRTEELVMDPVPAFCVLGARPE